jgi:hypothetical protein
VSRINTLQTKSIVAPEAASKDYGLDTPEVTVQLAGSSQATLLIGKGGEGVAAKDQDAGRPHDQSSLVGELTKDRRAVRGSFRRLRVQLTRLEVVHGG